MKLWNGETDTTDTETREQIWKAMKFLSRKKPKKFALKLEEDEFVLMELKFNEDNVINKLSVVEKK